MPDYQPQGRGTAAPHGHEAAGLSARKIAVTTTLLILFLIVAHLVLNGVMHAFAKQEGYLGGTNGTVPLATGAQIPPAPRLQPVEGSEWEEQKAKQIGRLNSYGWVDASHRVAHIPIEQAKMLLLQRGLPPVTAQTAPATAPLPEEKRGEYVR